MEGENQERKHQWVLTATNVGPIVALFFGRNNDDKLRKLVTEQHGQLIERDTFPGR